jgi:ribosomal protein L30
MTKPLIQITRVRSLSGCTGPQLAVLAGLGLHKKKHVRLLPNTPSVRGAMKKVLHMLEWVELEKKPAARRREISVEIVPPKKGAKT